MRIRMFILICVFAAVLAAPAFAQEGEMPQMTPEQRAEMEAYMKAGALGPQHELMAEHVGTYVGTYNDPLKGGPVTNRYVAKWTSPDEQHFAMYGPGRDGNEVKMMEMIYTRR